MGKKDKTTQKRIPEPFNSIPSNFSKKLIYSKLGIHAIKGISGFQLPYKTEENFP